MCKPYQKLIVTLFDLIQVNLNSQVSNDSVSNMAIGVIIYKNVRN